MRALYVRPKSAPPQPLKLASAWTVWRLPTGLALWAAISSAGAGWATWLHLRPQTLAGSHAFVAILLALLAATQAWLAWRLWPSAPQRSATRGGANCPASAGGAQGGLSQRAWLRAFFVGVVGCYGLTLFIGPERGGGLLFVAVAMSRGTLLALPLAAHPETIDRLRRWLIRPRPRRVGGVACWCCMALVALEGGLRACGMLWGPKFLEPENPIQVAYSHPHDFDFAPSRRTDRAALRVAVMGDYRVTGVEADEIGAAASANGSPASMAEERMRGGTMFGIEGPYAGDEAGGPTVSSLLASALPEIEVVAIGAPHARLGDYAQSGLQQARAAQPNLLLVFVSVGDDIAAESKRSDLFDWRSLSTSRAVARVIDWAGIGGGGEPTSARSPAQEGAGRWEDYVQACSPQLSACRKPIDASMQQRWKSTFAYFDELEKGCREAGIPLALVVAPSPVQTNRALLDAVCRRQGCSKADVDLELPQRRLAVYASQRNLPALDLLPALMQSPDQAFAHQSRQWTNAGRATVARALDGWLRSTFAAVLTPARAPVTAAWNPGDEDRLVAH